MHACMVKVCVHAECRRHDDASGNRRVPSDEAGRAQFSGKWLYVYSWVLSVKKRKHLKVIDKQALSSFER